MSAIFSYLRRNLGELVNLIEAILRIAGSIASLTPTPKDNSIVESLKEGFAKIKSFF